MRATTRSIWPTDTRGVLISCLVLIVLSLFAIAAQAQQLCTVWNLQMTSSQANALTGYGYPFRGTSRVDICYSMADAALRKQEDVYANNTTFFPKLGTIDPNYNNGTQCRVPILQCSRANPTGPCGYPGDYRGTYQAWSTAACPPTAQKNRSCGVGNPIDPASGNKYQEETDYTGRGSSNLRFVRSFNGFANWSANQATQVGVNWQASFGAYVKYSTATGLPTAYAYRPDGRLFTFKLSGGVFSPDADIEDKLVRVTDGSGNITGWQYRECSSDSVETYDALGTLISITDRTGQTQTLSADSNGRVSSVTGPFGHVLQASYTAGGRLEAITLPSGDQIHYEYDGPDTAYLTEVLSDNPQGYWRLRDASGTTAVSALPGGSNGTYGGGYGLGYPGRGGSVVFIDAAYDGEVNLGTAANYTSALTLEIWANPSSTQPDALSHVFNKNVYHHNNATNADIPVRLIYSSANGFQFGLSRGNDKILDATLSSGALPPGRWYHVVAVYRQSGQCELWVNGSMVASQTINFAINSNSRNWKLGNATENSYSGNAAAFSGLLTEAALYSSALSNARIQAHYNAMGTGNLARVEYPDGTARVYHYEDPAFPNSLTGVSLEDAYGVATRYSTFAYDSSGRAVSTEHSGGAEHFSLAYTSATETMVTDANGNQELLTFSTNLGLKNLVSRFNMGIPATLFQAFDANNNVISRTDFNGNLTCYAYDTTRNLETVRVEGFAAASACPGSLSSYVPAVGTRERKISTTWHSTFRLPTQIMEAGRVTDFTHDSNGNVLTRTVTDTATSQSRTWTYTYNTLGQVLTEDGARTDVSDVTTYTYYNCNTGYECGQLQTVTNAAGHVTTYNSYDAHGQPTQITDPNGVVTTLAYDLRQRLIATCVGSFLPTCSGGELTSIEYWPTGLLKKVTLPGGDYTSYSYDAAHRLTGVSDSAGNSVTYTLDAMGNRTAEDVRDSSSVLRRTHSRVYNTLNRLYQDVNAGSTGGATTTYGYDNNGNLTSANAPLGRNSSHLYDELNRLNQVTDPASGITYLAYDAHDNVVGVTDPNGNATGYAYNGFGDLTAQVSPDTGTTTHTYDANGNPATSTDARGGVATYGYDALNRVTSAAYTLSGSPAQALVFTYDQGTNGKGQLTGAGDTNHAISWTYDAQGRVTGKGLNAGGVVQAIGYGYTNGRLTALTLPSGNVLTYTYDLAGQVTSISMGGTTILSNATWEPFGPVKGWTWGNGSSHTRDHDQDGRVATLASSIPNGINLGYGYDAASRITSKTDSGTNPVSWTYGYDTLDRLTSAVGPQTQGWSYDANGNRLSETGANPTSYTVSGTSNRLSSTSGSLTRSYGYDAVGNTLTDGTRVLTYDARNRLATAQNGGNSRGYIYDALGQLIEATGTGGTVRYAYDEAGHLIGEYDGTGALIQETVWLGDIPVATIRPGSSGGYGLFYVHADHLNTPRKLIEPSDNTTVWRWDSDAFGNGTPDQDPDGNSLLVVYNLRFPGQVYDHVTDLNYNYFRDYDPGTGRYVESDPVGLGGGLNTYTYAQANPSMYADPTGEFVPLLAVPAAEAAITAIGGAIIIYSGWKHERAVQERKRLEAKTLQEEEMATERRAYHRRCDERPPAGLSGCDLIKWKIQRARDCIRMRSAYMRRWDDKYQGHYDQIYLREKELQKLEQQLKDGCCA